MSPLSVCGQSPPSPHGMAAGKQGLREEREVAPAAWGVADAGVGNDGETMRERRPTSFVVGSAGAMPPPCGQGCCFGDTAGRSPVFPRAGATKVYLLSITPLHLRAISRVPAGGNDGDGWTSHERQARTAFPWAGRWPQKRGQWNGRPYPGAPAAVPEGQIVPHKSPRPVSPPGSGVLPRSAFAPTGQTASLPHTESAPLPAGQGSVILPRPFLRRKPKRPARTRTPGLAGYLPYPGMRRLPQIPNSPIPTIAHPPAFPPPRPRISRNRR